MKTISRWTAAALAAALASAIGCGSTGGCGSSTANTMAPPITTCGYGTVAMNGQCVTQAATPSASTSSGSNCASGYSLVNGVCSPSH